MIFLEGSSASFMYNHRILSYEMSFVHGSLLLVFVTGPLGQKNRAREFYPAHEF